MEITFDPAKDAINIAKHGVSLTEASGLAWGAALEWTDTRKDHGELRQCALTHLADRVFFVVFVERVDGRRVISLRKANQREFDRYVTYLDSTDS